jgi:hypothetical protein
MEIKRHYECVDDYLANRRDEWVDIYEIYAYGENKCGEGTLDIWYYSSVEDAKGYFKIRKAIGLGDDTYIKQLNCYVDGAGIVWVRYTHTLDY